MSNGEEYPMEIDVLSVKALLEDQADCLLLDCRREDEHELAAIASGQLIPMDELPSRIGELGDNKKRQIVVYCHHGGRSLMVTQWLRDQGWTGVRSMAGGIDAWSILVDPSCPRY